MKRKMLSLLLIIACLLCGCAQPEAAAESKETIPTEITMEEKYAKHMPPKPQRLLIFQAEEVTESKNNHISLEEDLMIDIIDLKDITLELNGQIIPLKTAVREDKIDFLDFLNNARIDAANGFCTETYTSKHGVAAFRYTYPELDLELIYDVYETPDGNQNLVRGIGLYKHGCTQVRSFAEYYEEYDIVTAMDWEDWGLTFTVTEATPTDITLTCTQSGGQQIGQLAVTCFMVYSQEDGSYPANLDGSNTWYHFFPDTSLTMNGETQLHIDWEDVYGPIASGNYRLTLGLKDIYEESQVHPLMDNFYDEQTYFIDFTVS